MTVSTRQSDMDIFGPDDIERYRDEWRSVQAGFVDDPEAAVRAADRLVEQAMEAVTSRLAENRDHLTGNGSDDGQRTERLRLALRHYRALFGRLTGAAPETATERNTVVRPIPPAEPDGHDTVE